MNLHMSDEASNLQDLDAAEFCRPRRDCNQEHASPREIALALGLRFHDPRDGDGAILRARKLVPHDLMNVSSSKGAD